MAPKSRLVPGGKAVSKQDSAADELVADAVAMLISFDHKEQAALQGQKSPPSRGNGRLSLAGQNGEGDPFAPPRPLSEEREPNICRPQFRPLS
jgi:hypothetical protein